MSHDGSDPAVVRRCVAALAAHGDVASVGPRAHAAREGRHDGHASQRLPATRLHRRRRPPRSSTSCETPRSPRRSRDTGLEVLVGGTTAIFVDFERCCRAKLPLFIGLVVLLSFLLLAIVFRRLVIPLTAAVMNLLSIGAAFGVLVAVFQNGTLARCSA